MKTKELIRRLKEADPSGELECNCGLKDILFVDRLPYYYDGVSEVLIIDENKAGYNVVGAKFNIEKDKISIVTHSIEDALWDHPELPITYGNERVKRYQASHDATREEVRKTDVEIEKSINEVK